MKSTSYIQLDMQRPRLITVYAVQNDQLSRWIHADLTDGGVAWTPPSGAAMMIRYAKPDGTVGFYDSLEDDSPAYEISGSGVDFGLAAQCLTVSGIVSLEISFYTASEERLSAFSFLMHVERNPVTDGELESNDYFNILAQQIAGLLAATTHPPQISSTTHNWLIWDENENGYVDSGYSSVGETGPGLRVRSSSAVYMTSSSGTTHPDADDPGWSATPSVTPGTFIWAKVTVVCEADDDASHSGPTTSFVCYIVCWQGQDGISAPGTATPLSDSQNGAIGTSTSFARQDHRHPFDFEVIGVGTGENDKIEPLLVGIGSLVRAFARRQGNLVMLSFVAQLTSSTGGVLFSTSEDLAPPADTFVDFLISAGTREAYYGRISREVGYDSETGLPVINGHISAMATLPTGAIRGEIVWSIV